MNERIRELAKSVQCERHWTEEDIEKFAELIVEDACRVLLKWKGEPFPFDEDLAASLIKEHFGVK